MKILIVLCTIFAYVAASCTKEQWKAYTNFRIEYKKSVLDDEREMKKCVCFTENVNHVNKNNADPKTHDSAINALSGDCQDEYKSRLGYFAPAEKAPEAKLKLTAATALPASIDYRTTVPPLVTAVKDQGQCGSCYAFSSVGVIEGQYIKRNKKALLLSEQNIVDCSLTNAGCNGGNMYNSFKYVINRKGINTNAAYPYYSGTTEKPGTCKFKANAIGATLSSIKSIAETELAFMTALVQIGPVAIAIDAGQKSFGSYKGGIYVEPKCTAGINHAVLLVGYGTNMTVPSKPVDYWIVKNSWGKSWGDKGYFYLPRNTKGSNNCGMLTYGSYALI